MSVRTVGVRYAEASDPELVEAVRGGDDAAFEVLFRRHEHSVAAAARSIVHDSGKAEDVAQEAFVSALRRLRETNGEIDFRPWIGQIARNAAIDLRRRSDRAQELSIDSEASFAPVDARRLSSPRTPEQAAAQHEQLEHLAGALEELSETHQSVIVMRELEGRSYREIGDSLQLSQAAVESTLFRARRKLAREYAELGDGGRCRRTAVLIERLHDGREHGLDRRKLDRHARRCTACRRHARELGIEPLIARPPVGARIAGLLPIPAFLRKLGGSGTEAAAGPAAAAGALGPQGLEALAGASKLLAIVGSGLALGLGGAAVGGKGPLAVDLGTTNPPGRSAPEPTPRSATPGGASVPPVSRRALSPLAERPGRKETQARSGKDAASAKPGGGAPGDGGTSLGNPASGEEPAQGGARTPPRSPVPATRRGSTAPADGGAQTGLQGGTGRLLGETVEGLDETVRPLTGGGGGGGGTPQLPLRQSPLGQTVERLGNDVDNTVQQITRTTDDATRRIIGGVTRPGQSR